MGGKIKLNLMILFADVAIWLASLVGIWISVNEGLTVMSVFVLMVCLVIEPFLVFIIGNESKLARRPANFREPLLVYEVIELIALGLLISAITALAIWPIVDGNREEYLVANLLLAIILVPVILVLISKVFTRVGTEEWHEASNNCIIEAVKDLGSSIDLPMMERELDRAEKMFRHTVTPGTDCRISYSGKYYGVEVVAENDVVLDVTEGQYESTVLNLRMSFYAILIIAQSLHIVIKSSNNQQDIYLNR